MPDHDDGDSTADRYATGVAVMERLWGEQMGAELRATWQQADPDVERIITGFALGEIWSRPTLDLKTRSLICLAAAVALEREGQVRLHTHGALQNGATPAEITETLIQLMVYCGFPAAWQAMLAARQVIAKHAAQDG
jgi:alkylhydroperoxidase/carboxymuconolactone decarboxylase family protein YurZ